MRKINWNVFLHLIIGLLVIGSLVYSRFINLGWGLPYPLHPDEWNMATAIQGLNCGMSDFEFQNCLNPHFFAYGQFPLYLVWFGIQLSHVMNGSFGSMISLPEAIMALRIISVFAGIGTAIITFKIIELLIQKKHSPLGKLIRYLAWIMIIFSPGLIQFSHFGTTESLLMLFYTSLIYFSLLWLKKRQVMRNYVFLTAMVSGLATGTKISSAIFAAVPLSLIVYQKITGKISFRSFISYLFIFSVLFIFFFIISSPQNIISFREFISAMFYETNVASGKLDVFYTRQFEGAMPVLFQFQKIFPYLLGLPVFLLFFAGYLFLPWKKKEFNFLRLWWLVFFIPNSWLHVKWTRFMAPLLPLMLIFASLYAFRIYGKIKNRTASIVIAIIITFATALPGAAYMTVYKNPHVYADATKWIMQNIPSHSRILSEDRNPVNLPLLTSETLTRNYSINLINFYELDGANELKQQLQTYISEADYIIVPNRRVFMNYSCKKISNFQFTISNQLSIFNIQNKKCRELQQKFPVLNEYYRKLFSGELGFKKIAEFTSYPKISVFGKTIIEFPDEQAEETWSVFDHPVIRIYKKVSNEAVEKDKMI